MNYILAKNSNLKLFTTNIKSDIIYKFAIYTSDGELFSKEDNMSFFKKNQPEATIQKPSEEEAKYNAACINMEIATGNFKHMTQADICACVESCRPSK